MSAITVFNRTNASLCNIKTTIKTGKNGKIATNK